MGSAVTVAKRAVEVDGDDMVTVVTPCVRTQVRVLARIQPMPGEDLELATPE